MYVQGMQKNYEVKTSVESREIKYKSKRIERTVKMVYDTNVSYNDERKGQNIDIYA